MGWLHPSSIEAEFQNVMAFTVSYELLMGELGCLMVRFSCAQYSCRKLMGNGEGTLYDKQLQDV